MRAAQYITRCNTPLADETKDYLYGIAKMRGTNDANTIHTPQARVAALYLMMCGERDDFILKSVYESAMSNPSDYNNIMKSVLVKHVWYHHQLNAANWSQTQWNSWWQENYARDISINAGDDETAAEISLNP